MESNPAQLEIADMTPAMKDALLKLQMSNIQLQEHLSQKDKKLEESKKA